MKTWLILLIIFLIISLIGNVILLINWAAHRNDFEDELWPERDQWITKKDKEQ